MNTLTRAAITGFGCLCLAAGAAQAQVPQKAVQTLTKGFYSRSAGRFIGPMKAEATGYLTGKSLGVYSAAVAEAATRQIGGNYPYPAKVKVNKSRLQHLILKRQAEKNKKERAILVANILLQKDNLLRGYHLPESYLEGFFMKRIFPYQSNPFYAPAPNSDQVLYRGMLLTPDELVQILKKGFSPATARWNAGTGGKPAVSLSSSSVEATHYIFQSGSKKNGIGVVFEVKRKPSMVLGRDPVLNKTQTIYYSYEDIAPEDIVEVLVWGEHGLENIKDIFKKVSNGQISSHTNWTGQFGRMIF